MTTPPTLLNLIDSIPLDQRDAKHVIAAIREGVEADPTMLEQLFPGKMLTPKRMTIDERTRMAGKASARARKRDADDRYAAVKPVVEKILAEDPDATLAKIATALDKSGIKPNRSDAWSRATVNYIINRMGVNRDG